MNSESDHRNVIDRFKNIGIDNIKKQLDTADHGLHIAIENLERDFNMGSIVRSANAFGVRTVHVIGRRQWNKREAMKTDAYLTVEYHASVDDFASAMNAVDRQIIALDIIAGAQPLHKSPLPKNCVLIFGAEGPGISQQLLDKADHVVKIEQFGSTRSINVGAAAAVAMYAWLQQHVLSRTD